MDPEIANDKQLRKDYDYDVGRDAHKEDDALDVDDEYSELSGVVGAYILGRTRASNLEILTLLPSLDPRILVTTSRDPSSKLMSFSKEIRLLFPTGIRLNRGNLVLPELVAAAQRERLTDVVLLHEHR